MKGRLKDPRALPKSIVFLVFAAVAAAFVGLAFVINGESTKSTGIIQDLTKKVSQVTIPNTPTPTLPPAPASHTIPMRLHVFQSFNNCGPATLSMALSYVGLTKSQEELGQELRPYQIPGGDNDDKSVTLQEVADKAHELGLHTYLRPNGDKEKLKLFISNDIPVVARTWLELNEDIGHYRIIRGYDDTTQQILQDDSYQNKNLQFSYQDFNQMWVPFNFEYLIIVDDSKKDIVEKILGEELQESTAWQNALTRIETESQKAPDNWHLTFAKSRIYYYLNDYQKSVEEFEKVESRLSFRTLWYQIEPILSYYELKQYDRVMSISERILNNQNRAFSELYILRGDIYKNQGNPEAARNEYEKAINYNRNLKEAQSRLKSI